MIQVFDHDDRAVHDDAKIHSAQAQQVGRNMEHIQQQKGEQKRQRNDCGGNQCRADFKQEQQQNDSDQNDPIQNVMANRIQRATDELHPVV